MKEAVMAWLGEVRCPDCEAPLNADVGTCPYCYSTAPRSTPWQTALAAWWHIPIAMAAVAVLVAPFVFPYLETKTSAKWKTTIERMEARSASE